MAGQVMTKSELAKKLALVEGLPQRTAHRAVDSMLSLISSHFIRGGESVNLHGFGSLRRRRRKSFLGRNPLTGETVDVPERDSIHFKPARGMREVLN